jgi:hypothetical protein
MHRPARIGAAVAAMGALLAAAALHAAAPQADLLNSTRIATFFSRLNAQPDNYARLRYANLQRTSTDPQLRQIAGQVLVTEWSMFGRIGEAEAAFNVSDKGLAIAGPLPTASDWRAAPAADYIADAIAGRRILVVNEAHHRPQTRLLTLALLPRLRALGFDHFAIEGLDPADAALATRGYPTEKSGYYTQEPLYGEIVREALRLGFVVHAYEPQEAGRMSPQDRETRQAEALQAILEKDPRARLFVHAGYAHADKAPGRLPGNARPMAAELGRLTGIEPYTVDQTTLGSGDMSDAASPYRHLVESFPIGLPSVLLPRKGGPAWSYRPEYHDLTVLLPRSDPSEMRPGWLSRDGLRRSLRIKAAACNGSFPCLFEAFLAGEGDDAIPADQFVLLASGDARWPLYLAPGRYRLRIRGEDGAVMSVRPVEITDTPAVQTMPGAATRAPSFRPSLPNENLSTRPL